MNTINKILSGRRLMELLLCSRTRQWFQALWADHQWRICSLFQRLDYVKTNYSYEIFFYLRCSLFADVHEMTCVGFSSWYTWRSVYLQSGHLMNHEFTCQQEYSNTIHRYPPNVLCYDVYAVTLQQDKAQESKTLKLLFPAAPNSFQKYSCCVCICEPWRP